MTMGITVTPSRTDRDSVQGASALAPTAGGVEAPVLGLAAPVPDLFAVVPSGLFAPLASEYRAIYWETLARFYQYEFEEATTGLVDESAQELAADVLRGSPQWRDQRAATLNALAGDDLLEMIAGEEAQLRTAAKRIVERLERAGWFHFEYRSQLGRVLNIYSYAARILDALLRVARGDEPVLPNYAVAIQHALKPDIVAARPGWALEEARRKTAEFVRELKVLNRNIYDHTRRLLEEAQTARGVLEDLLGRYQRRVMGSFHKLKTVDNPFRHRGEIFSRLDAFEADDALCERAARWHAEQHDTDIDAARVVVAEALRTVRMQLDGLPAILHDIDERNSRFSGVARNRLLYLLSRNRHIDGQLQGIVDGLIDGTASTITVDVYHCRLLADDFLYVPRERRAPREATPLPETVAIDPARMRREAERALQRPFGERAISQFVSDAMGPRTRMPTGELPLATDDDYVRYLCVVAFGVAGAASFRFTASGCNATEPGAATCGDPLCSQCYISRAGFRVPAGVIERPTKGRGSRRTGNPAASAADDRRSDVRVTPAESNP